MHPGSTAAQARQPALEGEVARRDLAVGKKTYAYYSPPAAEEAGLKGISRLPRTLKVLLENLLRHEDGVAVNKGDVQAIADWLNNKGSIEHEVAFRQFRFRHARWQRKGAQNAGSARRRGEIQVAVHRVIPTDGHLGRVKPGRRRFARRRRIESENALRPRQRRH